MDAIEMLMHEHRIILQVCDAASREARRLLAGDPVDRERIEGMVDFIRTFADRCHHAKEEDLLFARMGKRGFPTEFGPIGVMLQEHEMGRRYIAGVVTALPAAAAGDAAAASSIAEALEGWSRLLRAHIHKEDTILYPMARELMTPEDMTELAEAFERVEREDLGEGTHERYHRLAHELAVA